MKQLRIVGVFLVMSLLMVSAVWGQGLQKHLNEGNALSKKGDFTGAVTQYRKVVEILKKGKNLAGAQQIQTNIGIIYLKQGQYAKAAEELETAVSLYEKPDKKMDLKLNKILATAHYKAGHYAIRASILEALLKKYKKIDNKTKADLLAELADSYRRNEIYSKAIDYYQQALKYYKKLKDTRSQALILTAMGQSQAKLGDFDPSIKSLDAALPLSKKLGNHQGIAEIYSNLGIAYWDLGEYPKALEYLAKAKKVESKENLKRNLGADYNNEGLVYKSAGNYSKAIGAIDISIKIAREIKDEKSEAIALSNHALINRILGKNEDAMKDYRAALKIYDRVKFKEGMASCYLGLGKLYEIDRLDYQEAYEYYQKALKIYRQLGNVTYQAEALNQIGQVLKKGIDRKRTTRDLIFEDDEPVFIDMPSTKAKTESLKAYREALKLAEKVGKKEAIWSAQQGIGYALKSQGKEKEAFQYYKDAIDTVISIRGSDSDSELMGDYLKDKEDLFTEAIEVASALYTKTKDKKYLGYQMEYQEIYKNEVMKNALLTAKPLFEDPAKAKLFKTLTQTLAKKKKVDQLAVHQENALTYEVDAKTKADKLEHDQKKKVVAVNKNQVQHRAKKLEMNIKKLLAKWKTEYPKDGMFHTKTKINIESIQKYLTDNQALIQYFPLPDHLGIICVTKKNIYPVNIDIKYEELAELISDDYHYGMEKYAAAETEEEKRKLYVECIDVLHELYKILILPVERQIEDKSQLVIVPSKYISYVPFAALVRQIADKKSPIFLISDKSVAYVRLSFIDKIDFSKNDFQLSKRNILAVANPKNQVLDQFDLAGAVVEVQQIVKVANEKGFPKPYVLLKEEATEKAWRDTSKKGHYDIYYFATHGIPFAEALQYRAQAEQARLQGSKKGQRWVDYFDRALPSKSPLGGFLYFAIASKSHPGDEHTDDDGALTLREISGLSPDSTFKDARIAVLSACNTAVTYSPKVNPELRKQIEKDESSISRLKEADWTPGVDQICLTDTFMRQGFTSVLGTFWMAHDDAAKFLGSKFFVHLAEQNSPSIALAKAQRDYLSTLPLQAEEPVSIHPFYWAVAGMFGQ